MSERKCFQLDHAEIQRRWKLLDQTMEAHKLDAILVQGACNAVGLGGHYFWITGISPFGSYPQTAIYWRESPMTLIKHGGFGQEIESDPKDAASFGIKRILGTPTFPGVNYTLPYDAEIASWELKGRKVARLGLISPGSMFHGFGEVLKKELTGIDLVDITDELDEYKAIKSDYEIELVRQAAAMQDAILRDAEGFIEPGLPDYEIMAKAHLSGERHGAAGTGIFLGSSFLPGDLGLPVRHRSEQGRVVKEGDLFFLLVENAGASGMYAHVSRFFSLGPPPQELVELLESAIEAQAFTCDLLVEGAGAAAVFAEYNSYMEKRGFAKESRLHAHGQGLDLVERPLVRSDESMTIRNGMNLGVHPFLRSTNAMVTICDNFIATEGGLERVHAYPQKIVELG